MKSIIDTNYNSTVAIPLTVPPHVDLAFRLSAIILCIVSVDTSQLLPTHPELALITLVLLSSIYLMPTTLLSYQRRESKRNAAIRARLGYIDSLLLGVTITLLPFSVVTDIAIALVVAIRAAATGGSPLMFGHLSTLALGAIISMGALQPAVTIDLVEDVSIITFITLPLFVSYVFWLMYKRQTELTATAKALNVSNIQLKLNNYKLAKYLSPSLRKAIFSGKKVALETQRKRLSVFFSDIKGFSELSEELEAETLTAMLNLYLTEMSDIALKFGGTIDKFIGDAIMVFYGDPITKGAKEDCIACVSMAIAMQKRMADLNKRWASQGIRKPLHVRMGINTGFCTVGNFGTENRLDYTLLGTQVNKASRLESAADAGEILISRQTYELIKDTIYCEPRGYMSLKGFKEPVETFSVVDLRANLDREGQCLEHSTEGFTMFLDVDSVPHMQKHRIMSSLEEAYEQLRNDIELNTREDVKIFK